MLAFLPAWCQQPAYFVLGEEELKGLQVYDVIQDVQHNYIISTNEGLFYYDYYNFEQIGCDAAKSQSMFNFVADAEGRVYCSNLNHQIFQIKERSCDLFYELQPNEDSPDLSLVCSPNGDLLIITNQMIRLSGRGKLLGRSPVILAPLPKGFLTPGGKVVSQVPKVNELIVFEKESFQLVKLSVPTDLGAQLGVLNFFAVSDKLYAVDQKTQIVYVVDESTWMLTQLPVNYLFDRSGPIRTYVAGANTWAAGTLPGAVKLEEKEGMLSAELLFPEQFISHVFQDHEGNTLLSTFDHGILVVADLSKPDVQDPFEDDPITAIHKQGASLYLGSSKGAMTILENGKLQPVIAAATRAIAGIYESPDHKRLILQGSDQIITYQEGIGIILMGVQASLKGVAWITADVAYLGTSGGIFRCEWQNGQFHGCDPLPEFSFRIHHLVYESRGSALIASTSRGLFRIELNGKQERITQNGVDLFPTALFSEKGKVYAAVKPKGILELNGSQISGTIQPDFGANETIGKFQRLGDQWIVKASHGLYQLDAQGKTIRNLGKMHGFLRSRVFDFETVGQQLWVSHSAGVQSIDLQPVAAVFPPPAPRLVRVMVNDSLVNGTIAGDFDTHESKIRFELAYPSLRHRELIRVHYQLVGYDKDWLVQTNDESGIVYNALAPGKYVFRAKAEILDQFSPEIRYSFQIATPIYARWWFVPGIVLMLAALLWMVYWRRMQLQRKKAVLISELNASKLAAIQSQMNPHFIFNAMNSIQDLILRGDIENSYSYVTTFSNLVRSALKYSEKEFIDFEEEMELLKLYLSLESLRFEDELEIEIEDNVDDDIQLPPLLIQPFVENALVHGLLHREGPKKLSIRFELNDSLLCTIEDNGIGLAAALELRERQRGDHESFSGTAMRKRFDILSDLHKGEFGIQQQDLMENGQPMGTRIVLKIPIRRRY